MKKFLNQLKSGILDNNPVLVQLLGMCPTLATTTTVKNAIGMGLSATAVLVFSNLIISLLRKFIPKEVRIAAYIVVISGFVTMVELLLKAFLYSLYSALGIFIPLIVVNCIILARAEAFASKNKPLPSAIDGLSMGLGFTVALFLVSTVREILGNGTFLGCEDCLEVLLVFFGDFLLHPFRDRRLSKTEEGLLEVLVRSVIEESQRPSP